jgi:hypothetical protein
LAFNWEIGLEKSKQSNKKISKIKVILQENKKFNSDIFDPVNLYQLNQDYNGFFYIVSSD